MKVCVKCKCSKELDKFHKNKNNKDGRQKICISCRSTAVIDHDVIVGKTKRCTSCKIVYSLDNFHNDRGGKVAKCKICCAKHIKDWYNKKYPERLIPPVVYGDEHEIIQGVTKRCSACKTIKSLEHYNQMSASKDERNYRCRDCTTKYCHDNKEKYAELNKKWSKENPEKVKAKGSKRRANKKNAVPKWLTTSDLLVIDQIYKQAMLLEEVTGKIYHVDHCVPLNNPIICGLHVPWNLIPMEASENIKKKNKLIMSEGLCLTDYNEKSWLELQGGY